MAMYLLYLDDSGSVSNPNDKHIVLAGVAVFERQPHWFSSELDDIARRVWPENPAGLEFRGSDIRSGRRHWRGVEKSDRQTALNDALGVLARSSLVHLFGAAIHKASVSPEDPMEVAFEQLCNRFDRFLGRLHKAGNTQRGLIILDESSYETSLQTMALTFRTSGHRWGQTRNISDVPLFVNSRATRMIQFADLVAYSVRRYYEDGDSSLVDLIAHRFDAAGGVLHGLIHQKAPTLPCHCLSCRSRP